ncbi:MAG: cytochrome P460 family protein [Myxococcota bacterium]
MIRDLTELAALAAVGGALVLGGCATDDDGDTDVTDAEAGCPTGGCPTGGCPTGGCPTGGCPTGGCPTGGCPTGTSGYDAGYASSPDFFTQMTAPVAGTSPHGTVWIYYSEDLRTAIEGGGAFTAPVGATSIKEVYTGGSVSGYAVMTKQAAGFDADHGDWFYELLDPSGAVSEAGTLTNCIQCHSAGGDTDYLLGTDL